MVLLKLILMLVLIFVLVYFSKQKELFFNMDGDQFDTCNEIFDPDETIMRSECSDVDGCIIVNGFCENTIEHYCLDRVFGDCKDGCNWNSEYSYCYEDTQCWKYNTPDMCNTHKSCNWSEPTENTSLICVTDDSIAGTTAASTTAASTTAASTTAAGTTVADTTVAGTTDDKDNSDSNGGKTKKETCLKLCNFIKLPDNKCAQICP